MDQRASSRYKPIGATFRGIEESRAVRALNQKDDIKNRRAGVVLKRRNIPSNLSPSTPACTPQPATSTIASRNQTSSKSVLSRHNKPQTKEEMEEKQREIMERLERFKKKKQRKLERERKLKKPHFWLGTAKRESKVDIDIPGRASMTAGGLRNSNTNLAGSKQKNSASKTGTPVWHTGFSSMSKKNSDVSQASIKKDMKSCKNLFSTKPDSDTAIKRPVIRTQSVRAASTLPKPSFAPPNYKFVAPEGLVELPHSEAGLPRRKTIKFSNTPLMKTPSSDNNRRMPLTKTPLPSSHTSKSRSNSSSFIKSPPLLYANIVDSISNGSNRSVTFSPGVKSPAANKSFKRRSTPRPAHTRTLSVFNSDSPSNAASDALMSDSGTDIQEAVHCSPAMSNDCQKLSLSPDDAPPDVITVSGFIVTNTPDAERLSSAVQPEDRPKLTSNQASPELGCGSSNNSNTLNDSTVANTSSRSQNKRNSIFIECNSITVTPPNSNQAKKRRTSSIHQQSPLINKSDSIAIVSPDVDKNNSLLNNSAKGSGLNDSVKAFATPVAQTPQTGRRSTKKKTLTNSVRRSARLSSLANITGECGSMACTPVASSQHVNVRTPCSRSTRRSLAVHAQMAWTADLCSDTPGNRATPSTAKEKRRRTRFDSSEVMEDIEAQVEEEDVSLIDTPAQKSKILPIINLSPLHDESALHCSPVVGLPEELLRHTTPCTSISYSPAAWDNTNATISDAVNTPVCAATLDNTPALSTPAVGCSDTQEEEEYILQATDTVKSSKRARRSRISKKGLDNDQENVAPVNDSPSTCVSTHYRRVSLGLFAHDVEQSPVHHLVEGKEKDLISFDSPKPRLQIDAAGDLISFESPKQQTKQGRGRKGRMSQLAALYETPNGAKSPASLLPSTPSTPLTVLQSNNTPSLRRSRRVTRELQPQQD